MAKLPTALLPRTPTSALLTSTCSRPTATAASRTATATATARQQVRHATEVARPKRPYTFTQIVQLSDGSTYTTRTTSPAPLLRSTKDTRNHLTWQPSEASLKNVEVDEAGKLARFRGRFGSMYDLAEEPEDGAAAAEKAGGDKKDSKDAQDQGDAGAGASGLDNLSDLLATYVRDEPNLKGGQVASNRVSKKGKKK